MTEQPFVENDFVEKVAKDCGFDFYQKISDPPIPCFSCTKDQLIEFARRCMLLKLSEES